MNTGITFASLRIVEKTPVLNEIFTSLESIEEISCLTNFRMHTGILLGPEDLLLFKESIIRAISVGEVGLTKNFWDYNFLNIWRN